LVTVGKTNGTMEITAISGHDYRRGGVLLVFWAKPTVIGTTPITLGKPLLGTCRNSVTTKLGPFKVMFSVLPPNDNFIVAVVGAAFLQIDLVIFRDYPRWYPAQANWTQALCFFQYLFHPIAIIQMNSLICERQCSPCGKVLV
jgi:hypothetical protein